MADDRISQLVAEHGWAVVKVAGTEEESNFAYSVGLCENFGHPEVIVMGLPPDTLQAIINVVGAAVKSGETFKAPGMSSEIIEGRECALREVASGALPVYMGKALEHYGEEFPALHVIWPDEGGRFPWDAEASPGYRRLQSMLSEGPEPHTLNRP